MVNDAVLGVRGAFGGRAENLHLKVGSLNADAAVCRVGLGLGNDAVASEALDTTVYRTILCATHRQACDSPNNPVNGVDLAGD